MTASMIIPCWGVCRAIDTVPAPAEVTTSIELASVAERATTMKPKALGPHAGGEAKHGHDMVPQDGATKCKRGLEWPLRGALCSRQGAAMHEMTWPSA